MTAVDLAQDIGDATARYVEAKRRYDEARDATEYDWGYYGQSYHEELRRAAAEIGQALDAYLEMRGIDTPLKRDARLSGT